MNIIGRKTGLLSTPLKYGVFTIAGFGTLLFLTPPPSSQAAGFAAPAAIISDHLTPTENRQIIIAAGNRNDVVTNERNIGAGAEHFIDSMAQKGLGFLADTSMSTEQKKEAFAGLLNKSFDMNTIGRFSLGRYWRVSTAEQRREYLDLFNNMVVQVYADRFSEYSGQAFETAGFRQESEKDTIVTSFVIDKNAKVQVDWRVRHKNGRYKVVDVMVEGVSMSMTQRSDFSAVIQRGGGNVTVLLDHLRRHQ